MTVRERLHALRLMEKVKKNPEYARQIGLTVSAKEPEPEPAEKGGAKNV